MKLNFKGKTQEEIKVFRSKIPIVRLQLFAWQHITITKLANIIFIDTIQKKMEARKFSKKIIQNTHITLVEFRSRKTVRVYVTSEYFSDRGFDVALAREKGTKRHFIKPIKKKALMWITLGVKYFSRGHYVSGIVAYHTIEETIDSQSSLFKKTYDDELLKWIQSNLGDDIVVAL